MTRMTLTRDLDAIRAEAKERVRREGADALARLLVETDRPVNEVVAAVRRRVQDVGRAIDATHDRRSAESTAKVDWSDI